MCMNMTKKFTRNRSGVSSTSAAASFNLAKAIVGAGSFSLPYVCKNEVCVFLNRLLLRMNWLLLPCQQSTNQRHVEQGIVGGLVTISACAVLASFTMQVINAS